MKIEGREAWRLVFVAEADETARDHGSGSFDPTSTDEAEYVVLPNLANPRIFIDRRAWRWVDELFQPTRRLNAAQWSLVSAMGRSSTFRRLLPRLRIPFGFRAQQIERLVGRPVQGLSLLLGSEGPERKLIAQVVIDNEVAGFVKIADDPAGRWLLKNEAEVLTGFDTQHLNAGPSVLGYTESNTLTYLYVTRVSGSVIRGDLDDCHGAFLTMLRGSREVSLHETSVCQRIEQVTTVHAPLATLWQRAETLCRSLSFANAVVHGDFAPWNVRREGDRVRAIDWEYGALNGIAGIDPVHFRTNSCLLLENGGPATVVAELKQYIQGSRPLCGFSDWYSPQQRLAVAVLAMLFDAATGLHAASHLSPINQAKLSIAEALLST